ncbi:MAG: hypothetical protein H6617_05135 [Bdellovibrionaceae bacterium]|nr:hypothetical protein [Bdellovibrionales bacterium]MCB9254048.1 hypothetical protein [Pseudobdellovibrionaceae bacterium]
MATSTRRFPEGEKFYYPVVAGDTLTRLIEGYYPFNGPAERCQILRQVLADNPDIVSPNLIYPGQLIQFRTPFEPIALEQSEVSELWAAKREWASMTPQERKDVSLLDGLNGGALTSVSLGAGSGTLGQLAGAFQANQQPIMDIIKKYESFKKGKITKGQYDYFRKVTLEVYQKRMGSFHQKVFYGGKTPRQVFRINPRAAGRGLASHLKHMRRLSSIARTTGWVLTAASLPLACMELNDAVSRREKNIIAVETGVSLATGYFGGLIVAAMVTGPFGLGLALVVGLGTGVASWALGKGAGVAYDRIGNRYDIVEALSIDQICAGGGQ